MVAIQKEWCRRLGATHALLLALSIGTLAGCGPGGEEEPASPALAPAQPERVSPPRLVILISLDTLRADHLGLYGYDQFTSPVLDVLAREAVVFEDVSSPAPWTLPAHGSMLTGLFPLRHGAMMSHSKLSDAIPTLASALAGAGYETAAVVNSTWLQRRVWGVTRGFEKFLFVEEAVDRRAPSTWVTDQAMHWLRELGDGRMFLFVHYYDLHSDYASLPAYERLFVTPYTGKADGSAWQLYSANLEDRMIERCRTNFDRRLCEPGGIYEGHVIDESFEKMRFREDDIRHIRELYDAGIRQLDTELGRFFVFLRQHELMDQALLIVTSDHGEEFMEHGGVEHSHAQYQESVRVPLLIRGPGLPRGLRVSAPVSLVDIAPTVLGLTRVESSQPLDGLDLAPLWNGAENSAFDERYLYGEASYTLVFESWEKGLVPFHRSLRRGHYKLYYDSREETYRLYDLETDPGETTDISARELELTARLTERMRERYRNFHPESPSDPIELDPADAERLKALGYVQ